MSAIADNLQAVQARISNAAAAVGRSPESVRLLSVSKTWPLAFFIRRYAWHVLDHAWEIDDRIISITPPGCV